MTKNTGKSGRKLSYSAIFVIGIFCAVILFVAALAIRHIHMHYSPTVLNSERLLQRGKPREAKQLLDKAQARGNASYSDSRILLLRGKVLFSLLVEQLNDERWSSYGKNPNNWLDHPLAAEAEKYFLDAMALDPNNTEIRLTLGNLYREQGRFGYAENILRTVLYIDNSNAEAYLALGLLYAEGRRPDAARRALAAAWELDRGNSQIAKNIALFYRFHVNAPESSIVWFNKYLDSNPKRDPDINLVRAELRNLIQRYPEFAR